MNNNDETKTIKIGNDVEARTSENYTLITVNVPIDVTFSHEKSAEEIEEIAFDEIDVLAASVADQTKFIGNQMVANNFSNTQLMKLGDALQMLGNFGAGLLNVSNGLQNSARIRRSENRVLALVPKDAPAETNERKRLFEKFTIAPEIADRNNGSQLIIPTEEKTENRKLLNISKACNEPDGWRIVPNKELDIFAHKIAYVLENGLLLENGFDAMDSILEGISKEADDWFAMHPELVRQFFTYQVQHIADLDYRKTALESITKILNGLPQKTKDELKQFDSMFDENPFTEDEKLAAQISAIMNNPNLPQHLRNVIAAEINEADIVDDFSPETVLHNLNVIREKGTGKSYSAEETVSQNNPPIPITTKRRTNKTTNKKKAA